jgi:hypothetical protein
MDMHRMMELGGVGKEQKAVSYQLSAKKLRLE